MTSSLTVPIPFLLDFSLSTVDDIVILAVAILVAVTVSAESQGFAATFLGDIQTDPAKRHHFNAFMHLDPLGTACFLLAGFGWAKEVPVDTTNFRHPRFFFLLSRLAGPFGNFLMANIAASLVWILGGFGWEDKVFNALIVVNLTAAVYGLLIIPPLPGAAILSIVLPDHAPWRQLLRAVRFAGPFLLVGTFLAMRILHWDIAGSVLNPFIRAGYDFLRTLNL